MDLTQLKHYLVVNSVRTLIDEPVGFDGLKTTIKRGDYHGVSAEVSVGTLEFYNTPLHKGADIIRAAYNTDIDTEVGYLVLDEDGEEVYSGVIDLSTYSETSGNATKISVKVGEVGVKTTFNNRTETEIDMNRKTTIDGNQLTFEPTWLNLNVPRKHLRYTNNISQLYTETIKKDKDKNDLILKQGLWYITIPLNKVVSSEFGDVSVGEVVMAQYSFQTGILYNSKKIYSAQKYEEFQSIFGNDPRAKITFCLKAHLEFKQPPKTRYAGVMQVEYGFGLFPSSQIEYITGGYAKAENIQWEVGKVGTIDLEIEGEIDNCSVVWGTGLAHDYGYGFYISIKGAEQDAQFELTIDKGSYFKMVMTDELEDDIVEVEMLPIHESLNKICGIISENQLTCKSDWYGRPDSQIEPTSDFGGGSLKALTNGYKIRDLFTTSSEERSMQLSFKDIIESLNVLDCIGWGFVEENGQLYIRVERWDWFYKNDIILSINDPNEIKRRIDTSRIYNDLSIGYKKYETSKEYNSIDSIMGERTFVSALKSISNQKKLQCSFVADNYAIEETRRARFNKNETEETTYDESIFVFELSCEYDWCNEESPNYKVVNNVVEGEGVARINEQINVQLSPRRCAERWRSFLFATNNVLPFDFISGKINFNAAFMCNSTHILHDFVEEVFLKDFVEDIKISEKKTIDFEQTKLKAEIIEFKYPITISQFKQLKSNPYGIIEVNGEKCWLKEITLKISTGECEFKVIPMNI